VRSLIHSLAVWEGKSTTIVTIGIGLAKTVLAVHGVDATGKATPLGSHHQTPLPITLPAACQPLVTIGTL
jgi:hypothetical protein